MLRKTKKINPRPIHDPAADAQAKTGVPFEVRKVWNSWELYMAYTTTDMFAGLGRGYKRHCGPVSVTNAILTLSAAGGDSRKWQQEHVQEVFTTAARIGQRHGIYWNMDFLHHFGGTQDLRCGEYLRAVMYHYGIRAHVIFHQPISAGSFTDALRRGSLLYIELRHHPVYGDHHVICCGMTEVVSTARNRKPLRRQYLIIADGWSGEPAYLDTAGIGFCHFFEIRPGNPS